MNKKQLYNKGPIGSYGSSTGPASGYSAPPPKSPFDGLIQRPSGPSHYDYYSNPAETFGKKKSRTKKNL